MELSDVSLPNAQSEDLHAPFSQCSCHWPRVPAVGVSISDQEYGLGGVCSRVAENLRCTLKGPLGESASSSVVDGWDFLVEQGALVLVGLWC